jgi:hypothetical protein
MNSQRTASMPRCMPSQVGENAARELWTAFFDHVQKVESSVWREVPELRVTVQR